MMQLRVHLKNPYFGLVFLSLQKEFPIELESMHTVLPIGMLLRPASTRPKISSSALSFLHPQDVWPLPLVEKIVESSHATFPFQCRGVFLQKALFGAMRSANIGSFHSESGRWTSFACELFSLIESLVYYTALGEPLWIVCFLH